MINKVKIMNELENEFLVKVFITKYKCLYVFCDRFEEINTDNLILIHFYLNNKIIGIINKNDIRKLEKV